MSRSKIELRWYQEEAVDSVWHYFVANDGNPVVALPTGTGKSIVIAELCKRILQTYPDQRILKLTHVKELIAQNFTKLIQIWPLAPAGIYSAGLGRREHHHPITYAGIASARGRANLFSHIDLILIDEAHTVGTEDTSGYRTLISELQGVNPALKVIGFTATPYRLGQGKVTDDGGLFTDICYDLTNYESFNRLIADGFISPLVPKRTQDTLDVTGVKLSGGDYNLRHLQIAVDKESITRAAIEEMCNLGAARKHWLIFAAGVEHSNHIAEQLNARGITAASIHSKLPDETRDTYIRQWKAGRIQAAVNNNVLTTGIDFPAIDLIGCLRPTTSPGLWVQMLGRGTRPSPGKTNCLVLDFAGNTARLGPINDPVLPRKRGAKGKGEAPVRCCPKCNTWNHISVRCCVECGYEFPKQVKYHGTADSLDLLAGQEPIVEVFPVSSVEYDIHRPHDGRPPSFKITYYSGLRRFNVYLALEHGSAMGSARRRWARLVYGHLAGNSAPADVDEAMHRRGEIMCPKNIKVWVNKHDGKHPEVMDWDFAGTGFAAKKR